MMIYFTADWHLGDNRFNILCRPFKNIEEHIDVLIRNHNELVKQDDLVYVNGDVVYQNVDPNVYLKYVAQFNGRKILIRGNHDRHISNEQFAPYFEQIFDEKEGVDIEVSGVPCHVIHYPTLGKPDRFNLVGHVHSTFRTQPNALNVGVDVNHFYPISEAQIGFMYNAIVNFYDSDIWSAYHYSNTVHLHQRNLKTGYLDNK